MSVRIAEAPACQGAIVEQEEAEEAEDRAPPLCFLCFLLFILSFLTDRAWTLISGALYLAVGFASVRHANHVNDGLAVINGVDDAVVADSNAPKLKFAFELLRAVGARVAAESENRCVDPLSDGGWQGGELLRGKGLPMVSL
jgi:hypothetical protein